MHMCLFFAAIIIPYWGARANSQIISNPAYNVPSLTPQSCQVSGTPFRKLEPNFILLHWGIKRKEEGRRKVDKVNEHNESADGGFGPGIRWLGRCQGVFEAECSGDF
jgi:hypothetical protein